MPDPIPGQHPESEEPPKKGFDPKAYFHGEAEKLLTPKKLLYKQTRDLFARLKEEDKQVGRFRADPLEGKYSVPFYEKQTLPLELPSIGCDHAILWGAILDNHDPDADTLGGFISNRLEDSKYIRITVDLIKDGHPLVLEGDVDTNPETGDGKNTELYGIFLSPEMDPVMVQWRDWVEPNLSIDEMLEQYPMHQLSDEDCVRVLAMLQQAEVYEENS
jgi:hypothetical protein